MASTVRDVIGQDLEDLKAYIEQQPALQAGASVTGSRPAVERRS
jgi:hypothetical protein